MTTDGEKTKVVIALDNPPAVPQPAHIHKGAARSSTRPGVWARERGRRDVDHLVDRPLEELRDQDFAINVHSSAEKLDVYVACGDVGSGSGTALTAGAIRR